MDKKSSVVNMAVVKTEPRDPDDVFSTDMFAEDTVENGILRWSRCEICAKVVQPVRCIICRRTEVCSAACNAIHLRQSEEPEAGEISPDQQRFQEIGKCEMMRMLLKSARLRQMLRLIHLSTQPERLLFPAFSYWKFHRFAALCLDIVNPTGQDASRSANWHTQYCKVELEVADDAYLEFFRQYRLSKS